MIVFLFWYKILNSSKQRVFATWYTIVTSIDPEMIYPIRIFVLFWCFLRHWSLNLFQTCNLPNKTSALIGQLGVS